MYTFLWTGKDVDGRERSERVEAENAKAARQLLTERGWSDLRLLKDETVDAVSKRFRVESGIRLDPLHPNEEAKRLLHGQPGYLKKWWNSILPTTGALLLCGVVLAEGIYTHRTSTMIVGGAGLVVLLLLFPCLYFYYSQTGRNYARLNSAKVRGDWNEVIESIQRLRRSKQLTRIGVGEVELTRNHALALAHLGRLEEAVSEFSRYENYPALPHWLYCAHLAQIYSGGRAYEKAVECQLQRVKEKPDMASGWTDLAYYLVHRMNQPAKAREALAQAEKLEISALGKPHLFLRKGMILWREKRPNEAKTELEKALLEFAPFARKPLVEGSILLTKAYLCASEVQLGDQAKARKLFAEVENYLVAHQEEDLLQACRGGITTTKT